MQLRRSPAFVASPLLVAAALLVGVMFDAPAFAAQGPSGKELPFKITFTGSVTVTFAPNFTHGGQSTFGGRCSVPSDWLLSWSGSGHASHVGAITASGSDCERFVAAGEAQFDDGEFEITSANGDTIHGTYASGIGNFQTGLYMFDWTFTGGTGRFASVTGHASNVFQINTTFTTFVDTGTGVISYGPSDGAVGAEAALEAAGLRE